MRTSNGFKLVKDIVKGDIIVDSDNTKATVLCVIKTKIHSGKAQMVKVYNFNEVLSSDVLIVTPYHPIFYQNKWCFPHTVGEVEDFEMDYMYNFVLDTNHIMNISNINVITMGHNYDHNDVLKHPFFGTDKVINELKSGDPDGWNNGLINFTKYDPKYDQNGVIVSFGKFN